MAGLRQALGLIKAQFTRAGNRLKPVRAETLLKIDQPLKSGEIVEGTAARNSKVTRVSLAQEKLLWRATSITSNATKTNGVELAHLPPAKGLLNLVDILCKDTSQSDRV